MSKNSSNLAFRLSDVHKVFHLPGERHSSLRSRFAALLRRSQGRSFVAVKDVDLEIRRGEFFGIVGRNGSGKSTLLKMLAGIFLPTAGNITAFGTVSPFLELGVGFSPELTARQNIFLNGAVLGMHKKDIEERYASIIHFAELQDFQDVKLKNFSSGMYVRLAFSVAIHAPTDILLMDEVLAVGDERFQEKCTAVFEELKEQGKTVILVSHDMGAIQKFCDRVLVVERGTMMAVAPAPEAVALYHSLNAPQEETDISNALESGKMAPEAAPTFPLQLTVSYLDDKGTPLTELRSGDALHVRVHYQSAEALATLQHCGIALYQEGGTYVFGTNTILDGVAPTLHQEGTFTLTYPSLPLAPGNYYVQVGMFGDSDATVLGFEGNTPIFTVTSDVAYQGVLTTPHTWTF